MKYVGGAVFWPAELLCKSADSPTDGEPNCRLRDCSGMGENRVLLVAHLNGFGKMGSLSFPAHAKAMLFSEIRHDIRTSS